ncbi:hypothetical protein [Aeromonas veronii]|uniref:hypothetical protein n=1 Tax=Aeromonas veronii TaxID=654 RepID=UPI0024443A19|nr:hypothetical protein [Aeromonas veronii]
MFTGGGGHGQLVELALQLLGGGGLRCQLDGEGVDGAVFGALPPCGLFGLVVGGLEVALQGGDLPLCLGGRAGRPAPAAQGDGQGQQQPCYG